MCLNNIGIVYRKLNKYDKALDYYNKALEIRRKTLPSDHNDIANCLHNIGNVSE